MKIIFTEEGYFFSDTKEGDLKKASWLGKSIKIDGIKLDFNSVVDYLNTYYTSGQLEKGRRSGCCKTSSEPKVKKVFDEYIKDQWIKQQEALRRIKIAKQKSCKKLNLSKLGLTDVPSQVSELTWLENLDLSSNQLTQLPDGLSLLSRLKILDLTDNWFVSFPSTICLLNCLKKLLLGGNNISFFPSKMHLPPSLIELTLSSNKLEKIPDRIFDLSLLRHLDLSKNKISSVPPEISNLKRLQYLQLRNNNINIVEGIDKLAELSKLDLSGNNELKELPLSFLNLKKLSSIDINNTQIAKEIQKAVLAFYEAREAKKSLSIMGKILLISRNFIVIMNIPDIKKKIDQWIVDIEEEIKSLYFVVDDIFNTLLNLAPLAEEKMITLESKGVLSKLYYLIESLQEHETLVLQDISECDFSSESESIE